jgi:hypothetical protein
LTAASTLAGFFAVSVAGANGDIYRWVDEDGQVHYSNAPSRMQSREEPVVVPLPSEPSPPSEAVPPPEGEAAEAVERAMVPPPDAPVFDAVPPDLVAPDAVAPATAPSGAPPIGTPAQTTLARISMERDYRVSRRRLNEIDRELTNLAEARTRFSVEGPESVGGLPTVDAPDVRSEEELVLEKEREALIKHLEDIRGRYNTLRGQVAAQHGGEAPAAWRELP